MLHFQFQLCVAGTNVYVIFWPTDTHMIKRFKERTACERTELSMTHKKRQTVSGTLTSVGACELIVSRWCPACCHRAYEY